MYIPYCLTNRYDLVIINSTVENSFIQNKITHDSWIRNSDKSYEGTFLWVDGRPMTFTNWEIDEPNNAGVCNLWLIDTRKYSYLPTHFYITNIK